MPALSVQRLSRLIGPLRLDTLVRAADDVRRALGEARVWNISSTAAGGGVAEMLHMLVGYSIGSGVDARWIVIEGDEAFFKITKRLHNRLHGVAGDSGRLGWKEAAHYKAVTDENASALVSLVRAGDVVILHDPQTVGLAGPLSQQGARVVWRCHIGTERTNEYTEEGWNFLEPHLRHCRAYVFSHLGFVPRLLEHADVAIIPPSIDPESPKNRPLNQAKVDALLVRIGLLGDEAAGKSAPTSTVLGGAGPVSRKDRVVVQVSRWDHLKDMQGVLEGFADRVAGADRSPARTCRPRGRRRLGRPRGRQSLRRVYGAVGESAAETPERDTAHCVADG